MAPPSLFDLRGRNALVTGSSRGIGKAIALALANAGANVAFHASTNDERLANAVAEATQCGVRATGIAAELGAEDAAKQIHAQAQATLGQIDILVCNASIQIPEPWLETCAEHFAQQVRVNLQSTFELMQQLAPAMAERGWGRIVTVGSVQEARPHPHMTVYAATKCAQTSLVRSLAGQLAASGVTVNNIAPGVIDTDRNSTRLADEAYRKIVLGRIPAAKIGKPEDCAGAALLLCSPAGNYITGQNIYIDGGMSL